MENTLSKTSSTTWIAVAAAATIATLGTVAGVMVARRRMNQDALDDEFHPDLPSSRDGAGQWVRMRETVRVEAPAEDCYAFWRNLENLEENMAKVDGIDSEMSSREDVLHWRQKGPMGLWTAEWDAEIVEDRKNRMIAWRSLPSSQIPTNGRVRFSPLADEDGTALTLTAEFQPPGGMLGAFFGRAVYPMIRRQLRADLYRVKHAVEYDNAVAAAK